MSALTFLTGLSPTWDQQAPSGEVGQFCKEKEGKAITLSAGIHSVEMLWRLIATYVVCIDQGNFQAIQHSKMAVNRDISDMSFSVETESCLCYVLFFERISLP